MAAKNLDFYIKRVGLRWRVYAEHIDTHEVQEWLGPYWTRRYADKARSALTVAYWNGVGMARSQRRAA